MGHMKIAVHAETEVIRVLVVWSISSFYFFYFVPRVQNIFALAEYLRARAIFFAQLQGT